MDESRRFHSAAAKLVRDVRPPGGPTPAANLAMSDDYLPAEAQARVLIDSQLTRAGWHICNRKEALQAHELRS